MIPIVVGLALAMDSFSVALVGATCAKKPKLAGCLAIAATFAFFQGTMPVIGYLLGISFRGIISAADHWIAFVLLSSIGAKMITESSRGKGESSPINLLHPPTLISLSIATSIDALMVGLGFAFIKTAIAAEVFAIGSVTFLLVFAGLFLGDRLGGIMRSRPALIGGLALVLLGVKILIEHLV